jgi:glycosyltransferase involved in cell wall biosynthesis
MTSAASPVVSICVPTFNRSRYLTSLLESLAVQLEGFPYPYELVIADNASPDDTGAVAKRFAEQLSIRYIRHDENIGCFANVQFVMMQAAGRYVIYLSDDDCLLGEPVAATIARMEADPAIAVVFAPWKLYDLVAQQEQGQFYDVPHDLRIEKDRQAELLDHLLRHHIFPEIHIARRDALQRLMPRINEHAFYAFVHAADYLSLGAVLIQKAPFYVSITRYFADEERSQAGNEEVEVAWDRYRGGLEYILARAGSQVAPEERSGFHLRIQKMIAVRMSVAVRLRHLKKRNPLDTYYIATRLKGMGYESLLPVPLEKLASEAMVDFLLHDPVINRGVDRLVTVGPIDAGAREFLSRRSPRPVSFVDTLPPASSLARALVFVSDRNDDGDATDTAFDQGVINMVRERDLAARFSL